MMLEYINEVAGAVAEKFPDVFIKTFAYMFTMNPPRNIRAADNVIVQWINWCGGPYGFPDLTRSLAHEDNRLRADSLREWGKLSKQIGIWDYYYLPTEFPPTNFNRLAGDFPLFDESDVELFFVQIDQAEELGAVEGPWAHGQFFFELDAWLAYQLMQDPKADAAALADRFLDGYYGAAAPAMRAIFTQLRDGDAMPRERLSRRDRRFYKFPYLTPEFYLALNRSLAQAEAAVADDPELAKRVRRHRVKSDMSLLVHWHEIASQLPDGEKMPFDRSEVIARLRDNGSTLISEDYGSAHIRDRVQANLDQRLTYYAQAKSPVEGLADGQWIDVPSWKFIPTANWALRDAREYRQDSVSKVGRAEVYSGEAMKTIDSGLRLGFNGDGFETIVPLKEVKNSEYTQVKVGQTSLCYSNQVWVQDPRFVVDIDLLPIRPGGDPANVVEVFVSLRLASDKKAIFLDGVQLRRVPEDAIDARMKAFFETVKEKEAVNAMLESAERVGLLPLTWSFYKDPKAKESGEVVSQLEFEIGGGERLRVLEPWTAQAAGQGYHGMAWYAADYKIPTSYSEGRYLLQFPSVDCTCEIWINGHRVADKPEGVAWDESFTVHLREGLVPGEANRIALRVEKNEFAAGVVGRPVLWRVEQE